MEAHYMQGARLGHFLRMLWKNRRDLDWKHYAGRMGWALFSSAALEIPGLLERGLYHRRIANTVVEKPPLFILGHWRSGTTYLFNLLTCDQDTAYMNSMHTFMFDHFLLLHKFLLPFFDKELDGTRPGDTMDFLLDSPQEECYALANMIEETFTHLITFPQNADHYMALSFEKNLNPQQRTKWGKAHNTLLKKMTYATGGKRILFKSPDNTTKAGMLHDLYPDAKFIHIYRDPYKVLMSTLNMFREGMPMMTFERMPTDEEIEDKTLKLYKMLYTQYFEDLKRIPKEQLVEINYADLVKAPMDTLEHIYQTLELPGFEEAKPRFQAHIDSQKHYKTNQFQLEPRLHKKINEQLGFFFEHYNLPMRELPPKGAGESK